MRADQRKAMVLKFGVVSVCVSFIPILKSELKKFQQIFLILICNKNYIKELS